MGVEQSNPTFQSSVSPQSLVSSGGITGWLDRSAKTILILPVVLLVLALSIFPLIISLYLSFTQFKFVRGGFQADFIGLDNYQRLLFGVNQREFLGRLSALGPIEILILALFVGLLVYMLFRYVTSPRLRPFGLIMRVISVLFAAGLATLCLGTLTGTGIPGTVVVTLIFVFGGVFIQYLIGLGLALLLTQNLRGRAFFRVIFLLPMMITPVGIGFIFKMMTDTLVGPFAKVWIALGLGNQSWVSTAEGARIGIMIGDIWQWTPFVFIILLAALEGVSKEITEAALVDGANRVQMFQYIVLPEIIPVSTTVVLIRLIEAFKIIDMPNILTGGGPGTATESITLQAYNSWRAIDLGSSAAMAYLLLILVTFVAIVFVNSIRRRVLELI